MPVVLLLGAGSPGIALVVFSLAALTDAIDGLLARRLGAVSTFGAFLDPLADKALVLGTLAGLVARGAVDATPVGLILAREAIVTGLRAFAAGRGLVIGSSAYGKAKACLQGAAVGAQLIVLAWPELVPPAVAGAVLWSAVAATLATGIDVVRRALAAIAAVGPSTMRAHAR
jgi:CDP-diacylglycerol--glycerol-3-phosphate 3-phosphatidyltransferase